MIRTLLAMGAVLLIVAGPLAGSATTPPHLCGGPADGGCTHYHGFTPQNCPIFVDGPFAGHIIDPCIHY